eukprot:CAMPEP_0194241932 /NCGR_PEP_ID=MMETSP0158-20130606/7630_1 /TAXON_ID=33649 /ORGANISM="Thalassionema nitzschioides, Strain L26-B" /LENGTH=505 /DNA_ID=CAMNT_0038976921 /DNA_START=24 /DNA_END=1541 /DNA_ORIENTATION=-
MAAFRPSCIRLLVSSSGPVTLAYQRRFPKTIHSEQLSLASRLDSLHTSFLATTTTTTTFSQQPFSKKYVNQAIQHYAKQSFSPIVAAQNILGFHRPPKGLYIHGSVGVGKSVLMDIFYQECCRDSTETTTTNTKQQLRSSRIQRCHFHEFMIQIHEEIHSFKKKFPKSDPIPAVAAVMAEQTRLLCLDEMQVTDIADAMVLKRLLTLLLQVGVIIVTTSNRPPEALYEGGLNRSLFLPFIDVLKEYFTVVEIESQTDYRRIPPPSDDDDDADVLPTYVWPSTQEQSRQILEEWFFREGGGENNNNEIRTMVIPVAMGREIQVSRTSCGGTRAWFQFDELCHQPLGAADYLALTQQYTTIIVENIPQLDENHYNEARRFVTFIDALYESRSKNNTQVVLSAAVPLDELLVEFEASVTSQDGDEELLATSIAVESVVIGEGGSSSSNATTTIQQKGTTPMEWSATGRIGVSLAQLSSVREVSFSFQRAASRLAEMCQPRNVTTTTSV